VKPHRPPAHDEADNAGVKRTRQGSNLNRSRRTSKTDQEGAHTEAKSASQAESKPAAAAPVEAKQTDPKPADGKPAAANANADVKKPAQARGSFASKPLDKPSNKSVEQRADKPVNKPADKPASKPDASKPRSASDDSVETPRVSPRQPSELKSSVRSLAAEADTNTASGSKPKRGFASRKVPDVQTPATAGDSNSGSDGSSGQ